MYNDEFNNNDMYRFTNREVPRDDYAPAPRQENTPAAPAQRSGFFHRTWVKITALVLASFFVGVYFDMGYIHIADMIAGNADEEGVMMAFITLNMVEIFHCFNMRSRRASLFTMKKQNKWLWASAALALVLTVIVTVQPTLAEMFFGPVTLELKGVLAALGLAFLIIPLMEIYKAIMRAVEKE